jgi:hypothetical protein
VGLVFVAVVLVVAVPTEEKTVGGGTDSEVETESVVGIRVEMKVAFGADEDVVKGLVRADEGCDGDGAVADRDDNGTLDDDGGDDLGLFDVVEDNCATAPPAIASRERLRSIVP